ncbi:MAG: type II toxin-antitoxin system ParD family antitoxin [Glaciecola sp.]|jgi:antitoxin ParD1/3/4|nr:type II toxin-antitoxin system ParD family antitoxin [Glaciecola sp.]MDG1814547.1 type II toxin-antitoxin system ParD family antitoxin [Glaciecola sp.]MDG2099521.1 type II toxin-antitoxin system ParD family antitoxin [Glaciecola sp.]
MATTSVDLGEYFTNFVQELKSSGRYRNTSEALRAGLRLLEREESEYNAKLEWLRKELTAGEDSGISDKKMSDIIAEAKAELNDK